MRWRSRAPRMLLVVTLAVASGLGLWLRQLERRLGSPYPMVPTVRYEAALASLSAPGETQLELDRTVVPRPFVVRGGQTLSGLLNELGLEPVETSAATSELEQHFDSRKLRTGEQGVAYYDMSSRLAEVDFRIRDRGWLQLSRRGDGWIGGWQEFVREERLRRVEGRLEDFLENAISRAGGHPGLAVAMSQVLQWDLDFHRDLRVGDRFQVLYEELWIEGERSGPGRILALVYESRGRRYEAYGYGERDYYDASGRPLQKMFLRSPLPFTRVTSRFTSRRFHPILKVHRPHYGVDYGAPTGTPVRVTASGTVTFVGRSGGAGKMVKVRHTNGYLTAYLHLSGYARGLKKGRRVSQGDVIGFVGSTGLSTAPHLDYRVQKNGRWIDPLKLESVPAKPIPRERMAEFLALRDVLRQALEDGLPESARPESFRVARVVPSDERVPAGAR